MHDFQIIEAADFSRGKYVLIMDGQIITYGDNIMNLTACVHQLVRLPHSPQIRNRNGRQ